MVAIEEVMEDNNNEDMEAPIVEEVLPASEERRLDAEAIEEAGTQMTRVSAKLQLEALAKKLRKESEALARVEQSRKQKAADTVAANKANQPEGKASDDKNEKPDEEEKKVEQPPAAASKPAPVAAPPSLGAKYTPIDKFAFDAGGYNDAFVTLYIELEGVGSIPRDQITCQFTKGSFDLVVSELNNKSYRLFKDQLEKDIDPDKSKFVVKKNKVLVKLHKVKQGDYGGFDYWSKLTDTKKSKKEKSTEKDNPQASIMNMMKEMYDSGDDNMKKMIGETMMKQRNGELGGADGGMGDMGMGGMGMMGDDDF